MSWIFYLIGGFVAIVILIETGILAQFFTLLVLLLISGFVGFLIGGGSGAGIGVIVGVVLYLIICIAKIVNPDIKAFVVNNVDERSEGIAGLVMLAIVTILLFIFR